MPFAAFAYLGTKCAVATGAIVGIVKGATALLHYGLSLIAG
ncbi:hypothetical protein PCO31110_01645 [Pandoraea communis]|uniref:Uncharacterized protein n=1 Tax=Pandoraea communis TaxID=2508297 RepID=A0A5E4TUH6_9BURK|nr:hypothetical protein PCO31110_01645 [Pandoraea communis]